MLLNVYPFFSIGKSSFFIANFQLLTKNDLGDGTPIIGVGQKQTYSN